MKEEEIYKRLRRVNQVEVLAKILADISNEGGGGGGGTPEEAYKFTSYIIDQRDPQKPYIIKDVPSMNATETMEIDGKTEYVDVIARIRDHSFICLGNYDGSTGYLDCYPTDKTDKLQLIDGTQLGEGLLSSNADMFMKLPEFWWKCENIDDDSDYVRITFTDFEPETNEGWNHWQGDTFIGVYKGYIDNGHSNIYRSIMSVEPSYAFFTQIKGYIDDRNINGIHSYSMISYESHCIMALLGFGWVGTTAAQTIIGTGGEIVGSTLRYTGGCDDKGMTDTVAGVDGDDGSINFWGLEDWWVEQGEFIDNLEYDGQEETFTLKATGYADNNDAPVIRSIQCPAGFGLLTKCVLGEYADLIPKEYYTEQVSGPIAYATISEIDAEHGECASRSGYSNSIINSLATFMASCSVSNVNSYSRLQYKGSYRILDEHDEVVEEYTDPNTPIPEPEPDPGPGDPK